MSLRPQGCLLRLAHSYGVQTAYYDVTRQRQPAAPDALLAVLQALGCPVANPEDAPNAYREYQQTIWNRVLEPVTVTWNGQPPAVTVRLPHSLAETRLEWHLQLGDGGVWRGDWSGDTGEIRETTEIDGAGYIRRRLILPGEIPLGYHRLTLDLPGMAVESLIISTPAAVYSPATPRRWGVFLPLYALHSANSWGGGDLADLGRLMEWLAEWDGGLLATLPLLPVFTDTEGEVSPYLPVSRRLWNEFYVDINTIPELAECPTALKIMDLADFQKEADSLRHLPLVDYQRQMALQRRVLEELSKSFFSRDAARFAAGNPLAEDYARFRAARERLGSSWRGWPAAARSGSLREDDYDEATRRYHLYVQYLMHRQLTALGDRARDLDLSLCLDLPAGVHPDGYDVWREGDLFLSDITVGAPPDTVFPQGQNWTFPPLHPERLREHGYRYFIESLRHHLRPAGVLRIDHVMGLHRLFCIPHGQEPSRGVYLRYRADELYAILALESHRSRTAIVGEDLGIVPGYVRPAMRKYGLNRMYILHYELAGGGPELAAVPSRVLAALNTHDMPPFAGFWQGKDITERQQLGILDDAGAATERKDLIKTQKALLSFLKQTDWLAEPTDDISAIIRACLAFLAASRAGMVLVNLEDLWLETRPQNIPSSSSRYPSWRRKARYPFEEFCTMPPVVGTLQIVNELRRAGKR